MRTLDGKVSVVIPNYNGIKFIDSCMRAVNAQSVKGFETIVVDNGSTDGSRELVKERYDNARLIELDKNYGFSRAVNEGIRAAKSEFVILLNNDTEVHKDFVKELLASIEESDKIFSCSAKMLQLYDKELIDDAGDYYCALGWAYARGKGKRRDLYNKSVEIFASCAGAAIYRREIFDRIGYFDEAHFAYLEDIDIGYRAKIYGYINKYCPKALVYHAGSGASGSRYNEFKIKLTSKNSIYIIYKNMPLLQLVINLPLLVLGFIIKTAFFIKKGYGVQYVSGLFNGIKMADKDKKVKFDIRNIVNYIIIQLELWINIIRRLS